MRKYITRNEWFAFFKAIDGTRNEVRDKAMIHLAYMHGLRVSELINIKVTDVDINEKIIYIKRLKNGLSTTHPLQPLTIVLLQDWLKERPRYVKKNMCEYLFVSTRGDCLSRQWIYRLCVHLSQRAGLKIKVHPHMLRHACGYELANQGLDTRLIQDYLGHRNIHHTVLYTASNASRFQRVWQ